MNWQAQWIKPNRELGNVAPLFTKSFTLLPSIKQATLYITAIGVYEATINGIRISNDMMTPGWTTYKKRLQFQTYDVTALICSENIFQATVGKGWHLSRLVGWEESKIQGEIKNASPGLLAQLEITYENGTIETITSDDSWDVCESQIRYSEIYDGEVFDASLDLHRIPREKACTFEGPFEKLIPQEGVPIRETEHVYPFALLRTPKNEIVIDFGQEITGYVQIHLNASEGETVKLSHAEVLDKNGNFYTENYRSAKANYQYTCKNGKQSYKPKHTFYGFRYIRIDSFPGGCDQARLENFVAIVVHSNIKRTGHVSCADPQLNQLFENILWGQKGNFLDIPTDCPQRDERLGWTGDAQVFVKAAAISFDVESFFKKWLSDLAADQGEDGHVGHVIPDLLGGTSSAAWGDAATICPWEIYMAYGNQEILVAQFESMKKWISYITLHSTTPYLWTGGTHFGDWLGLDAPQGSYKGSTREDFIASAFYAHSTSLVIKAGKVLKQDMTYYEDLYKRIVETFRLTFTDFKTQTECVLAAHFNLADDSQKAADQLAEMVEHVGTKLQTGFVGTPYLLHVLSNYGYTEIAYSLLLRREYPSWLYSVNKGATTVWEHWDGIMENGEFWSKDMNSYNHYAYGAVIDWVYTTAAGIRTIESNPGYEKIQIIPHPDHRLGWLKASIQTRHGLVRSEWKEIGSSWRYEIETPVDTTIQIADRVYHVSKGIYTFFES